MVRRTFCKVLLAVVVAVFSLFVFSGVLFAQGNSEAAFDRVADVQERHTDALMAKPGVVGTAVGLDDDGGHVVIVLLENPGVGGIPKELEGVPVRAMVTGEIYALAARPAPIGVSTGHPAITAGTIACRVKKGDDVYALSNNHVYAVENTASIGDAVIQPGTLDGGKSPADDIGTLYEFKPIKFRGNARNEIDAAIALSSTTLLGTATPSDGYGVPSSETVGPSLGLYVQKYGRTTGLTQGYIAAVNASVRVFYGSGQAIFVGQIIIEPGGFSSPGDSGSLIVTDYPGDSVNDKRPVGLLFAGSSTHTIANPIDAVLGAFGVTIDDTPQGPVNNAPIVTIYSPTPDDVFLSGSTISFVGAASDEGEDGDITGDLAWTSSIDGTIGIGGNFSVDLSDGVHTIIASVIDSGGATGSDSISITVGTPPSGPTTVSVAIGYATEGGRNGDKHLSITVVLVDNLDDPVGGASVSIDLFRDGSLVGSGSGTTGANGILTFTMKNAKSGIYTTEVTAVTAAELTWDGITPDNSFEKK